MPVRGIAHPEPGATEQDALLRVTPGNPVRQRMRVIGVVRGLGVVRAEILELVSALLEDALPLRLHLEAGVVGCDENLFGHWRNPPKCEGGRAGGREGRLTAVSRPFPLPP